MDIHKPVSVTGDQSGVFLCSAVTCARTHPCVRFWRRIESKLGIDFGFFIAAPSHLMLNTRRVGGPLRVGPASGCRASREGATRSGRRRTRRRARLRGGSRSRTMTGTPFTSWLHTEPNTPGRATEFMVLAKTFSLFAS